MTPKTRRDWTEILVGSLVIFALSQVLGVAAAITIWTVFWAGWLHGRLELRREMRRDILDALTKDPDHAA